MLNEKRMEFFEAFFQMKHDRGQLVVKKTTHVKRRRTLRCARPRRIKLRAQKMSE